MSTERERVSDLSSGPDPFSDEFAATTVAASQGAVDVIHGVYAHSLPLAGMTVRDARLELADRMNISPEAIPVVDGHQADEDTVLIEGQVLNFVKHAGEKGR